MDNWASMISEVKQAAGWDGWEELSQQSYFPLTAVYLGSCVSQVSLHLSVDSIQLR